MADDRIIRHYSGGALLGAIDAGLEQLGITPGSATIDDLAPVDEFHIGGRPATRELCEQLGIDAATSVLDVGCGIGGTARFMATAFGCSVTGIDLTQEYVDVARALSERSGPADRLDFGTASALSMPFPDASFDRAVVLHVGMNIVDKAGLFHEVRRLLRPGGRLGIYDVMRMDDRTIEFPMPWATDAAMSFVEPVAVYRAALEAEGFTVDSERDRGDFAAGFFQAMKARATKGPPPLGLHVIMGDDAPTKIGNMVAAVTEGIIAPVELVCTAV
jgi:ubiquinone/menaquinone biosynthesis C-methylase UbiE